MKRNMLLQSSMILAILSSTVMAESLKGRVFEDTNKNGVYDKATDLVLKNVNVLVTDAQGLVVNVKTNKYGVYKATGISTGLATINIDENTLPGINPIQVVGTNPSTKNVIAGKQNWSGKDGYTFNNLTGTVCGDVFYDANRNHIFNQNEGKKDYMVSLIDANGDEHNATTDINGRYCIPKVVSGKATINIIANESIGGCLVVFTFTSDQIDVVNINKINEAAIHEAVTVCF